MRQHIVPLLAANALAFAAVGASYLGTSRLLTADEFGAYTAALAAGSFAVLVLDGGIKTGIIKRATDLTPAEAGGLLSVLAMIAATLLALLALGAPLVARLTHTTGTAATLVLVFAAIYLVTYPYIGVATALLERQLRYREVSWIEGVSIFIERCGGLPLLVWTELGLASFAVALMMGRGVRTIALAYLTRVRPHRPRGPSLWAMMREGAWFQVASASSFVRDNLHVLMLGPLVGAAWVGYYGWAMQLCVLASQIFVQVSSRVSLPLAAQTSTADGRWALMIAQARTLAMTTAPILAAVVVAAPTLDELLFHGKWFAAIPLLALLCLRMVPGVASTPMGSLVLVDRGTRPYAAAIGTWTVVEILAAAVAIAVIGAQGLAWSYSLGAWAGIYILVAAMGRERVPKHAFRQVVAAILGRPSVWISLAFAVPAFVYQREQPLPAPWVATLMGLVVASCLIGDVRLRRVLLPGRS